MKSTKLIFLFVLLAFQGFGQSLQQEIDPLFYGKDGLKAKLPTVGISIGVTQGNETRYFSFGDRYVNGGTPVDSNTVFEIGSATKTFTALLLAYEIASGRVAADDFMDTLVPKNIKLDDAIKNKVRLTDLASQQSGLPNISSDSYIAELFKKDSLQPFSLVDKAYMYDVLTKTTKLENHGKYKYNNYAFSLLGLLIANKEKSDYETVLKKRILTPLKMRHTTVGKVRSSNTAGRYDSKGHPKDYIITNAIAPAGALKSNAVDLMKYLKRHIQPTNNKMGEAIKLTHQQYYKDSDMELGLGWSIIQKGTNKFYGKSGDTFGNSSLLVFDKANKIGIVVLSNHQNSELVEMIFDKVYESLLRQKI
ncbi:serine hydrolase domain-containing protein [Pontibacter ruber]|uniref:Serine hydrolase domain-containing protein n=1 Tax=Pontibacter ruber TaxID=1343895 RepID=A0ABW5CWL2_9BACT|nr:serine hydrolase domain-containing protein [Pontibacter ruber]